MRILLSLSLALLLFNKTEAADIDTLQKVSEVAGEIVDEELNKDAESKLDIKK